METMPAFGQPILLTFAMLVYITAAVRADFSLLKCLTRNAAAAIESSVAPPATCSTAIPALSLKWGTSISWDDLKHGMR